MNRHKSSLLLHVQGSSKNEFGKDAEEEKQGFEKKPELKTLEREEKGESR
jgi:hypothetical protein